MKNWKSFARAMLLSYRTKRAAVAAAFVCLVITVVAVASIPDSNGVIHGCYQRSNGQLRITDDSTESCRLDETAISWNTTGQPGVSGYEIVRSEIVRVGAAQRGDAIATCTPGKKPVGGGYTADTSRPPSFTVFVNGPYLLNGFLPTGWEVIHNETTLDQSLLSYAVCVTAS